MLLYKQIKKINKEYVKRTLNNLLKEDTPNGDPTTTTTISKNEKGKYVIRAREKMVFCGSTIIKNAFTGAVKINMATQDGDPLKANTEIAHIHGNKREILTKERLVLNMIQHLSGIATNTNKYVKKINNNKIKILDTRKTTPGLRIFEKNAVYHGGGSNHRLDLSSGIMIKDNHITNNIDEMAQKLKKQTRKLPIQMEIDNINQISKANTQAVDAFLLDNMQPAQIRKCIRKINQMKVKNKKIFIEVSGGITLKNILKYNIEGVNGISIGALTHQSQSVDIGLDIES